MQTSRIYMLLSLGTVRLDAELVYDVPSLYHASFPTVQTTVTNGVFANLLRRSYSASTSMQVTEGTETLRGDTVFEI